MIDRLKRWLNALVQRKVCRRTAYRDVIYVNRDGVPVKHCKQVTQESWNV